MKYIKRRWMKIGYEQRTEINEDYNITMYNAYSPSGDFIGDWGVAKFLFVKKGIRQVYKSNSKHCACSIGFNPIEQKWYGWSHRAIFGFKIGNRIFEPNYGNDKTHFSKHGSKTIECLADAKQAAINFANYIG